MNHEAALEEHLPLRKTRPRARKYDQCPPRMIENEAADALIRIAVKRKRTVLSFHMKIWRHDPFSVISSPINFMSMRAYDPPAFWHSLLFTAYAEISCPISICEEVNSWLVETETRGDITAVGVPCKNLLRPVAQWPPKRLLWHISGYFCSFEILSWCRWYWTYQTIVL